MLIILGGGGNSRATQLFITLADSDYLGRASWETPFGIVSHGEEVIDNIYIGYGDGPPFGNGPDQSQIHEYGNPYIRENFPNIDFIYSCVEDRVVHGQFSFSLCGLLFLLIASVVICYIQHFSSPVPKLH